MPELRRGVTRTVLLLGSWAFKLPSFRSHGGGLAGVLWSFSRGVAANLSEREWSAYAGDAVAPVLFSAAGLLNIYTEVSGPEEIDYPSLGFIGPTDNKPHNVGRLHGRLVWVDYDMSWNDCPPCQCRPVPRGRSVADA